MTTVGHAQYEKKLTLNFQGGYIMPMGGSFDDDNLPYLWSNYNSGFEVLGALQYNFSDQLAVGISLKYLLARDWDDPRVDDDLNIEFIVADKNNSFFNSVVFNGYTKYTLSPQKTISPYFYGGIGVNVFNAERSASEAELNYVYDDNPLNVEVTSVVDRDPAVELGTGAALTFIVGPGLDINVSESLSVLVQVNYNVSLTRSQSTLKQNISHIGILGGVGLNLFRSKSF